MPDIIENYIHFTEGLPTPMLFRQWTGIACIAAALERRVWISTARAPLFPNLYVMLVAAPGVGKDQAINQARMLWEETNVLKLAPTNMSRAGLIDALRAADRKALLPDGLYESHPLIICAPELGDFLPAHELGLLGTLNHLYENHKVYRELKRGLGKEILVEYPTINLMAGAQPGYMAELFPESAWSMGTFSRVIMVYQAKGPTVNLFEHSRTDAEFERLRQELITQLRDLTRLRGHMVFDPEAKRLIEAWNSSGAAPVPTHSKLQHYSTRRILHVLKLTIIAAVSRHPESLLVEPDDFIRARDWLLEAEALMPDVFREMLQKSDREVVDELHFYIWNSMIKNSGKGVQTSSIYYFLQQRVPSEKIARIIEVADRAGMISRQAGTEIWIAKPKHEHGVE